MRSLPGLFSLRTLLIAAIAYLAFGSAEAKANTYTFFDLHSDQGYLFHGMDDSGVPLSAVKEGAVEEEEVKLPFR